MAEWTLETLMEHFTILLAEMDRRYEQRFEAQEKAIALAMDRVDKEFHEHLLQVREENRLALASQDKAVIKQEAAVEKRFESLGDKIDAIARSMDTKIELLKSNVASVEAVVR